MTDAPAPRPVADVDPGLDLAALRAVTAGRRRTAAEAVQFLIGRIEAHLTDHDGYVAFSGGKDSLVVLHLARMVDPDVPVVFFDSGLEYPQTYTYLADLATRWTVNLHLVPTDPPLLDVLVASQLWEHGARASAPPVDLHRVLIGDPSRRAHEMFGPGELWGVRADESRGRRMAYTRSGRRDGVITRGDGTTAFGPIWDWSTDEVWAYIGREKLPVNPVYDILDSLGAPQSARRVSHLLDGTHLHRGRTVWLRRGWPELFEQLADALPRLREMS